MKNFSFVICGLALIFAALGIFQSIMLLLAIPLLSLFISYWAVSIFLYRPPENHLGVIYQFDRLVHFVGPEEWFLHVPGIHQIKSPIDLRLRRAEVVLEDLLTGDLIPLVCKFVVYHHLDLRQAAPYFKSQALNIPENGWESIIQTVLRETAIDVVGQFPFQRLFGSSGHMILKRALSSLLAERLRSLGLVVNPRTGVSVQSIKPSATLWQAMLERLAASSRGEASLARIRPILLELKSQNPGIAWETFLMEMAASGVQSGRLPAFILAPPDQMANNTPIRMQEAHESLQMTAPDAVTAIPENQGRNSPYSSRT